MKGSMATEWDKRAHENAYHWVLSKKQQWDDKEEYLQEGRKDIERYVLPFLEEIEWSPEACATKTALDIGCGTGRLCKALSPLFHSVVGIDISPEMIRKAKQDLQGVSNVEVHQTSGEDLALIETDSIHFCFSYIVFQHIPDKKVIRKYIQEIHRVLKESGAVKFQVRSTPGNPPGRVLWFKGFQTFYVALCLWRNFLPIPWFHTYDTVYGACYNARELKSVVQKAGFTNVCTSRGDDPRHLWVECRT